MSKNPKDAISKLNDKQESIQLSAFTDLRKYFKSNLNNSYNVSIAMTKHKLIPTYMEFLETDQSDAVMESALDCLSHFINSFGWIHDGPDEATFTKVLVNLIPKLTIENLPYLLDCLPRLYNRAENVFLPELKIIGNLLNTHSENSVIVEKLVKVFTSLYALIWNDEQDLKVTAIL
ncbi:hypothetical protein BC833DRAFT_613018 [Globomyces pollinis-pini]|nr:hypothetical protein BC833DRAFT_613018 [Globomyces pollinis-pini]